MENTKKDAIAIFRSHTYEELWPRTHARQKEYEDRITMLCLIFLTSLAVALAFLLLVTQ